MSDWSPQWAMAGDEGVVGSPPGVVQVARDYALAGLWGGAIGAVGGAIVGDAQGAKLGAGLGAAGAVALGASTHFGAELLVAEVLGGTGVMGAGLGALVGGLVGGEKGARWGAGLGYVLAPSALWALVVVGTPPPGAKMSR